MPYRKSPLYAVKFLKTPIFRRKTKKSIENLRSGVKTPSLAQLDESFKNTKKVRPILKRVSDVILFFIKIPFIIIQSSQYLEIAAIYPHCLSDPIMLQIT